MEREKKIYQIEEFKAALQVLKLGKERNKEYEGIYGTLESCLREVIPFDGLNVLEPAQMKRMVSHSLLQTDGVVCPSRREDISCAETSASLQQAFQNNVESRHVAYIMLCR